jgi:hypothetical protein
LGESMLVYDCMSICTRKTVCLLVCVFMSKCVDM